MTWLIGIDEAGYGPNLGPFVMTAVACRVPDRCAGDNLWDLLGAAVRKKGAKDARLVIDDSKVVYSTARGLAGLERGVRATLGRGDETLHALLEHLSPDDVADLRCEPWYKGDGLLPLHLAADELVPAAAQFSQACAGAGVTDWFVCGTVVCPSRFNALLDSENSKAAVLADGFARLLGRSRTQLAGEDLRVHVDKHGGRNNYAPLIQHALPDGVVIPARQSAAQSVYEVRGLDRAVCLTFEPRADAEHFCVALASMTAKYLRELLMLEFNAFWQQHVPGLKPTAGYPSDAARFFDAIRSSARRLGISEESLWRRK
jgi:ribonuclease HII